MKTKNILCAVLGAAALVTAPNVFATIYTGTITVAKAYGNDNGGGAIRASTSNLGTFDTFCLNSGIPIQAGVVYNFITGPSAIPGAPSTVALPVPNPVSIGTAWLFSQFAHNAVGFQQGSAAIANGIQAAIWFLEGDVYGVDNAFVQAARTALGYNNTQLMGDANGAYGVFAINVYDSNGSSTSPNKQPLLGIIPEPSTVIAGALLLLPFGVSTVRILRKNKSA